MIGPPGCSTAEEVPAITETTTIVATKRKECRIPYTVAALGEICAGISHQGILTRASGHSSVSECLPARRAVGELEFFRAWTPGRPHARLNASDCRGAQLEDELVHDWQSTADGASAAGPVLFRTDLLCLVGPRGCEPHPPIPSTRWDHEVQRPIVDADLVRPDPNGDRRDQRADLDLDLERRSRALEARAFHRNEGARLDAGQLAGSISGGRLVMHKGRWDEANLGRSASGGWDGGWLGMWDELQRR